MTGSLIDIELAPELPTFMGVGEAVDIMRRPVFGSGLHIHAALILEKLGDMGIAVKSRIKQPCEECEGTGECACCGDGACSECGGSGTLGSVKVTSLSEGSVDILWAEWKSKQEAA